MLKTTIMITLSIAAALFNGNTENFNRQDKNSDLVISHNIVADTTRLKVGDKSPDIAFQDTSGHDVKLSDFKGKYILIDVWASWCYPCRIQHPHLVTLQEKMKNKSITFVNISIDTHVWRWKGLRKEGGEQWMVKDRTFEQAFGINTIPRFILLDKSGRVLNLNMPMPSHPELEEELNKLKNI